MIEDIVKTKKALIDRESIRKKERIDIVTEEFNKKRELLEEHMEKYNQSENETYNQLSGILENLHLSLSLESKNGGIL